MVYTGTIPYYQKIPQTQTFMTPLPWPKYPPPPVEVDPLAPLSNFCPSGTSRDPNKIFCPDAFEKVYFVVSNRPGPSAICFYCSQVPRRCQEGLAWGTVTTGGISRTGCIKCELGYHEADGGANCIKDCLPLPNLHQDSNGHCVYCGGDERWDDKANQCKKICTAPHEIYDQYTKTCNCDIGSHRNKGGQCISCPTGYSFKSACDACIPDCGTGEVYILGGCVPKCVLQSGTGHDDSKDLYTCLFDNNDGTYASRLGIKNDRNGQIVGSNRYCWPP
jgi:hypothetical protein